MSCRTIALLAVAAFALSGCGAPTEQAGAPDVPAARLSIRAHIGPEITGSDTYIVADDSLIVRAEVLGAPELYAAPVLTVSDTMSATVRPDGAASILRAAGTLTFGATAQAWSERTRPRTLEASGKLTLVCQAYAAPGLNVAVRNSMSGAALAGPGAIRFFATNGVATDSLRLPFFVGTWSTAWERPGTWSVSIDAEGYRPWRQDGLVVTKGLCHVRRVAVTALLQRPS